MKEHEIPYWEMKDKRVAKRAERHYDKGQVQATLGESKKLPKDKRLQRSYSEGHEQAARDRHSFGYDE